MAFKVDSLEGNENAAEYTRKAPAGGRWGQTWDAFKGNFGKIVFINIIMLVFFAPAVAIIVLRSMYISGMGMQYPFNSNTGIGYPAYPGSEGLTESIYLSADLLFYSLLIVAGFIASIGIAGGAYSLKKLMNTGGEFSFKSFFRNGVKSCYFNAVFPVTLFLAFFFMTALVGDWKDLAIATGSAKGGPITAYVFAIIATVLVGIYSGWLLAVGVSYKLKITTLIKNSFVLMIGTPIQTIFFAGLALMPVWLYLIGLSAMIVQLISYIILVLFGLSFILLVWMSYTQGVFDAIVTPNIKAAEEAAKAKRTPQQVAIDKAEEEKQLARELVAAGKSELIGKPILPIAEEAAVAPLGMTYTRADVSRVSDDKKKLAGEISAYEQEHKNDPVYAEYNKLFAEREKALQSDGKKGKKKKVSSENLLR